jgi:hypothetical protein
MRTSILIPFLFGQEVEVTRDVETSGYLIQSGTRGLVVGTRPGQMPCIQFQGISLHLPVPNLYLLHVNEREQIKRMIK